MSKGLDLASPIIILNMGGEMIYILDQRLRAQEVIREKSVKVLNDVAQSLFSDEFMSKLFENQKVVSINYTRQLFEKVVHCSIMKLNDTSMGKLFDLMTMGLKYEVISAKSPQEIYQITLNHFNGIINIIKDGPSLKNVNKVKDLFIKRFSKLPMYDYILIKQEILKFLQDKMIRVSIFLQENLQNNDGSIVILTKGIGPVFVKRPGTVISYKIKGKSQNILDIKSAKDFYENNGTSLLENKNVELGVNLYAIDRKPFVKNEENSKEIAKNDGKSKYKNEQNEESTDDAIRQKLNSIAAKNELNSLANLVTGKGKDDKNVNFKINLFPERKKNIDFKNNANDNLDELIVLDCGENKSKDVKLNVEKMFDFLEKNEEKKNDGDDLLDLMDSLGDP